MISIVKQTDITDCGVACVKSVLFHFNIDQNLATIKKIHPLKIGYYSFSELSQIFEKYNLEADGYFSDYESLVSIKSPIIAHIKLMGFLPHFVVINGIDNEEVTYMDPNRGKILKTNREQFLKVWTGKILIVQSKNIASSFNMISLNGILSTLLNKKTTFLFSLLFLTIIWLLFILFI